jgi:tetratricopeptide (TPR) repeat protein
LGVLGTAFWLWMLYDCLTGRGDRQWIYLLVFLNAPGALLYFLTQWLPNHQLALPNIFSRWTRRQEIDAAVAETLTIRKSHQFVKLGNLLFEVGEFEPAAHAFHTAPEKEPENPHALWGAASIDRRNKQWDRAADRLKTLMRVDPDFGRGDASLAYGEVLVQLKQWDLAKTHLENDIRKWGHPETYLMLATIYRNEGNSTQARQLLETMLTRINTSYAFNRKRHRASVSKARQLLKSLA